MEWLLVFALHSTGLVYTAGKYDSRDDCRFAASLFLAKHKYNPDIKKMLCLPPDTVIAGNVG